MFKPEFFQGLFSQLLKLRTCITAMIYHFFNNNILNILKKALSLTSLSSLSYSVSLSLTSTSPLSGRQRSKALSSSVSTDKFDGRSSSSNRKLGRVMPSMWDWNKSSKSKRCAYRDNSFILMHISLPLRSAETVPDVVSVSEDWKSACWLLKWSSAFFILLWSSMTSSLAQSPIDKLYRSTALCLMDIRATCQLWDSLLGQLPGCEAMTSEYCSPVCCTHQQLSAWP